MSTTFRIRQTAPLIGLIALLLGFASAAGAATCDANNNGVIDRTDINLIMAARNQTAVAGDPRDANGDGLITVTDARICSQMCTLPDCSTPGANAAPSAVAKSYAAQANMKVGIAAGSGLLVGATDPNAGQVLSVGSVTATTPAGGTLTVTNGTGAFEFDPPAGAVGNVTFTYTVCDNASPSLCSAPALATVNVSGPVIWFVNGAAGPGGDGRLSGPFNTLAAADAVDDANHAIFLHASAYATGLTLQFGEALIGQGVSGASFDAVFGISPPAGTIARPAIGGNRPTLQATVNVASNSTVRGLNIDTSGLVGLNGNVASAVTVNEVSVTSLGAAAVSLNGTAGSFSLTRVSSSGGVNGIAVQNNGSAFNFAVTGTGAAGSGGTIQATTGVDGTLGGVGILLNNTRNISLAWMQLNDHPNFAIRGIDVAGFTLSDSVINGINGTSVSSPNREGSIAFGTHSLETGGPQNGLTGSAAIVDSSISGAIGINLRIANQSGTLDRLTISNSTFGGSSSAAAIQNDASVQIESTESALVNVTVQNSFFTSAAGNHFNRVLGGPAASDLVFTGNTISNVHPSVSSDGGGIRLAGGSDISAINPSATFNISGNVLRDVTGNALEVSKSGGAGTFVGTIANNTIGVLGVDSSGSRSGSGIFAAGSGGGTFTASITGNTVRHYGLVGVLMQAGGSGVAGSGSVNFTATGNSISNPGPFAINGIRLNGGVSDGDAYQICLDFGGAGALANSIAGSGSAALGGDFRLRQRFGTTVRLPGYAGGSTDTSAVVAYGSGRNAPISTPTGSATVEVQVPSGGGFVGGLACPI